MKALILAGGRGNRINEISNIKNKCMTELNGKPLLEYSLRNADCSDINEIVIVVGYRAEDIINYYGNKFNKTPIKYVIQGEQKGLVHALECSKSVLDGEDFMLFLGDEILINPNHKLMLKKFKDEELFGICGLVEVDDKNKVSKTYAVIQDDESKIFRLIEKPRKPFNNLMGTGNCIFKNEILSYIERTPINHVRGEKELPDLIQCAVDEGNIIKSFLICDLYVNINSIEDLNWTTDILSTKRLE